ncbi:hypothetical protein PgNI_10707 [Pyricularia grisea]|uniref:Uncharacterized protein n=1 Tax=Pyricularia grisea TaxID=148305 RepID=A0A6P8AXB5_PYRGI|nr:hypothetical protein PgNI_10707 [Pyricularia grisea]TLD06931.1 hypothetical protein PgNI_10707 [Pyricularia grisea]
MVSGYCVNICVDHQRFQLDLQCRNRVAERWWVGDGGYWAAELPVRSQLEHPFRAIGAPTSFR